MKVLVFGGSGMVGRGVLQECLRDGRVDEVVSVSRSPLPLNHPKLRQVMHPDLFDLTPIAAELTGVHATFDSVGVSSAGKKEPEYRRLTYDLTMGIAAAVAEASPGSLFVYVSGAGTSITSRVMWARVKGETEDAVAALPLRAALFRPGIIQPQDGIEPRSRFFATALRLLGPALTGLRRLAPNAMTSAREVGRAMIEVAVSGAPTGVVDTARINALAG